VGSITGDSERHVLEGFGMERLSLFIKALSEEPGGRAPILRTPRDMY
jgi:hypothetical protein